MGWIAEESENNYGKRLLNREANTFRILIRRTRYWKIKMCLVTAKFDDSPYECKH